MMLAATWLAALLMVPVAAAERPNIIVIYADDVGYGDLGCYGATAIETPNLDRLASTGIRFTSAYASASTCTPSRYSLLTGQYAFRNEGAVILPGNAPLIIDPSRPTVASVLRDAGYRTGLVGKWHLGLGRADQPLDWNANIAPGPREVGFQHSFHMAATGDRVPTVFIKNGRVVNGDASDPIKVSYTDQIGDEPTGISHPQLLKTQADEQHAGTIVDGTSRIGWMTGGEEARWTDEEMPDRFLQAALEFIEQSKDEPFFLYYATHENHVPRLPHPRFRGSTGLGLRGDAVAQLDWSVGKVMETLERFGLKKDTLVIFSSDNGPVLFDGYWDGAAEKNAGHRPSGPWRGGKYSAWEGGTRLPLIVSWPGTVKHGLSDALVSQVDLLASLASLVGAEVPDGEAVDSQDMSQVLLGRSDRGRDHLVQQGVGIEVLRQGPWKYIPAGAVTTRGGIGVFNKHPIEEPGALFYLPEDPEELRDLAASYPAKVSELRKLLDREVGTDRSRAAGGDELGGAQLD